MEQQPNSATMNYTEADSNRDNFDTAVSGEQSPLEDLKKNDDTKLT